MAEGLALLKLEMSSLDIAATILELEPLIKGTYLDNIYQIDSKVFLFKFRPGDFNLIVEVGRRIHLTKYEVKIPREPSQFCMALRKRLRGGRVIDIRQLEFERIVILEIEAAEQVYQVIVEFFRRGNLVVVDESGTISLALSYARMRDRNIITGEVFKHAPPSGLNPFKLSPEALSHVKERGPAPVTKALVATLSLGGSLARELLLRSGLKDIPTNELTDQDLSAIYDALVDLQSELAPPHLNPMIVLSDTGDPFDIAPFSLKSYEHHPRKGYITFNEAADDYFTTQALTASIDKKKEALRREEKRLAAISELQQKQLQGLTQAIEENSRKGRLIIKHLYHIQGIYSQVLAKKEEGLDSQEILQEIQKQLVEKRLPIQMNSLDIHKGVILLNMEQSDVRLSIARRPQDEAANYFRTGKKAKEKMSGLLRAIEETSAKTKTIGGKKEQVKGPSRPRRRRERAWYEKFRWFLSSEEFLVLAGRDATTNEVLIKKHTDPLDIVLHADMHGAPFVVIKTEARTPSESTILEAAQMAVSNSKMWALKAASGDAFWVHPDQVSKTAPSGQYLTRGAFVITGKRNYVKGVELRLAIGVQLNESDIHIIGGPPRAVQAHADAYVEVVPGATPRHNLAKQTVFELSKKLKLESQVRSLRADEVLEFLPPGPCDLLHLK